ncbi:MAG: NAD(P)H-dependent oxidoreductase [Bacteroidota bacterium]
MDTVLKINTSARRIGSVSRKLVDQLVDQLSSKQKTSRVINRDLTQTDLPFLDEELLSAFNTPIGKRTSYQDALVKTSNKLIDELRSADTIVIGLPIYNFGVPAVLKAWIDLIARAGVTFKYSKGGPQGFLRDKEAYIIVVSNGTAFQGEADFASNYIKHILNFIGIDKVHFIAADRLIQNTEKKLTEAQQKIEAIIG